MVLTFGDSTGYKSYHIYFKTTFLIDKFPTKLAFSSDISSIGGVFRYISRTCWEGSQSEYRGPLAKTETGYACKAWNRPSYSPFLPKDHRDKGLQYNNCRNPGGENTLGAWCYSTNPDHAWEYCEVRGCKSECNTTILNNKGDNFHFSQCEHHKII